MEDGIPWSESPRSIVDKHDPAEEVDVDGRARREVQNAEKG